MEKLFGLIPNLKGKEEAPGSTPTSTELPHCTGQGHEPISLGHGEAAEPLEAQDH